MGAVTKKMIVNDNTKMMSKINEISHIIAMYVNIYCYCGDQYINFKKNPLTILEKIQCIVPCDHKLNTYHTIPSAPNGAISSNRSQQIINILGGFK